MFYDDAGLLCFIMMRTVMRSLWNNKDLSFILLDLEFRFQRIFRTNNINTPQKRTMNHEGTLTL